MTARARSLVCGLVVALVTAWSGQAAAQSIYRDYYTPQFYMDHLVFYDEAANPIYYVGDMAYSVPSDTPFFEELVVHYQQNADAYHRWFEEVGYAHLNYRRPVAAHGYTPMYYLDYPVFFDDAGRPVYYVDGVAHPIPPSYPRYHLYLSHWRARRALYRRWYNSHGRHYRWWRRPIATGYYRPLYYDGYVVFYDDSGAPYYYLGGRTVYIPRTHRDYHRYHSHWRTHRANYRRWYKSSGRRHHTYRQPKAYRRRAVVTAAPRAVRGRAVQRTYRRRPVVRPRPGRPGPHARPVHPGRPGRPGPHARPVHPGRPGPHARPGRPGPQARPAHPGRPVHPRERPGYRGGPGRPGPQARPGRPGPQARPGPGRPVHPRERPGVGGGPGRPGPQARPGRPGPQARPGPGRPVHPRERPGVGGGPGRPGPHARPGRPGPQGRPAPPPGRPGPRGGRIDCRSNPGHPSCAGRAKPPGPHGGGRQAGPAPGRRGPAGPPPGGHKKGPRPGPRGRHR